MATSKTFVVCIANAGYEASLERRKIYELRKDAMAEKHGQLRVVDESGEDYLYPAELFAHIELPRPLRRAVMAAVQPCIRTDGVRSWSVRRAPCHHRSIATLCMAGHGGVCKELTSAVRLTYGGVYEQNPCQSRP